jgi:hypothetical protein
MSIVTSAPFQMRSTVTEGAAAATTAALIRQ